MPPTHDGRKGQARDSKEKKVQRGEAFSHPGKNPEAAQCRPHKGDPVPLMASERRVGKENQRRWRMCVDFTDLNKAYPKDSYSLLSIDALVDSASGCRLLSFLDAFLGYNQIRMHPRVENKCAKEEGTNH